MADKNAPMAIKMLHYHGFSCRTDVTSRFIGHNKEDDIGRADIFAGHGGKPVHVEVKRGLDAFNLDDWRENQREWARYTMDYPFEIPYWLFFTMGKDQPHYSEDKGYSPRKSWLIPYQVFMDADAQIRPYQKSIVVRVKKGVNKNVQRLKLDAVTLFDGYDLLWQPANSLIKPVWMMSKESREANITETYGGFWVVPKKHPFYTAFALGRIPLTNNTLSVNPYPVQNETADA